MAYVTTGTSGTEKSVVIVSDDEECTIHLSPDEARRFAIKLLELAQQAEQPEPEWP